MIRLLKGAFLGGIVVYLWSMVSWMALPWHARTFQAFEHDVDVIRMLDFAAPSSGVYIYPSPSNKDMKTGEPLAFVSYSKEGMRPMRLAMGLGLCTSILGAFILCWLLTKTSGLGYTQKVLFAAAYGLAVGFLGHTPDFIWWHFPMNYTLVAIADNIIGWTLAGLAIGKVI